MTAFLTFLSGMATGVILLLIISILAVGDSDAYFSDDNDDWEDK